MAVGTHPSAYFLYPLVFFDLFPALFINPIRPALFYHIFSSYSSASLALGLFDFLAALLSIFTIPLLAALSDRLFSRSFFIALLQVLNASTYLAFACFFTITVRSASASLTSSTDAVDTDGVLAEFSLSTMSKTQTFFFSWYLFSYAFFSRLSTLPFYFAYLSDITPPQARDKAFASLISIMFFSVAVSPLLSLSVMQHLIALPWLALFVALLGLLWTVIILPESIGSAAHLTLSRPYVQSHTHTSIEPTSTAAIVNKGKKKTLKRKKDGKTERLQYDAISANGVDDDYDGDSDDNKQADRLESQEHGRQEESKSTHSNNNSNSNGVTTVIAALDIPTLTFPTLLNDTDSLTCTEVFRLPFRSLSLLRRNDTMKILSLILFLANLSTYGIIEMLLLYFRQRLSFTPINNAVLLSVFGFITAFTLIIVQPILANYIGLKRIIILALLCNCIHVMIYSVAGNIYALIPGLIFGSVGCLDYPSISAVMSQQVNQAEQGEIHGAIATIRGITQGVGPLIFSLCYSYFTSDHGIIIWPQAPLALGAALVFIGFIYALYLPNSIDSVSVSIERSSASVTQESASLEEGKQRSVAMVELHHNGANGTATKATSLSSSSQVMSEHEEMLALSLSLSTTEEHNDPLAWSSENADVIQKYEYDANEDMNTDNKDTNKDEDEDEDEDDVDDDEEEEEQPNGQIYSYK